MSKIRFIHTADLHLDSPFKGISEINDALSKELADATFNAFENIIDLCIKEKVDFLLISGDVYDSQDKSLRAQLKFIEGLDRLSKEGIQTYVVHGNHDPSMDWASSLEIPINVHVFKGKKVHKKTFEKNGVDLAEIYGFSYYQKAITESVIPEFEEKVSSSSLFSIGLLHCNLSSSSGHEPYAPCTARDLSSLPVDYWALGHIHNMRIVQESPFIAYPGNTQGRHIIETGEKGCFLVEVDEQHNISVEFKDTSCIRWETRSISIEDISTFQELVGAIYNVLNEIRDDSGGRPSICRIILTGRGDLSQEISKQSNIVDILSELRESETTETDFVWIEEIVVETGLLIDIDELREAGDFTSEIIGMYDTLYETETERQQLLEFLQPLFNSPRGRKYLSALTDKQILELAKKAEMYTLGLLQGDE